MAKFKWPSEESVYDNKGGEGFYAGLGVVAITLGFFVEDGERYCKTISFPRDISQ